MFCTIIYWWKLKKSPCLKVSCLIISKKWFCFYDVGWKQEAITWKIFPKKLISISIVSQCTSEESHIRGTNKVNERDTGLMGSCYNKLQSSLIDISKCESRRFSGWNLWSNIRLGGPLNIAYLQQQLRSVEKHLYVVNKILFQKTESIYPSYEGRGPNMNMMGTSIKYCKKQTFSFSVSVQISKHT